MTTDTRTPEERAEMLAYLSEHPLDAFHSESCQECLDAMDRCEARMLAAEGGRR